MYVQQTEHPGSGIKLSDGERAVKQVIDLILESPQYANNTLILVTYDGMFHVDTACDRRHPRQHFNSHNLYWRQRHDNDNRRRRLFRSSVTTT
jgi:hypothetical protein